MSAKIQDAENIIHSFPKAGKGRNVMVARSRLLNLIKETSLHPLIVVQASAGYGKTVLLQQWHKCLVDRGTKTGWLLVTEDDNDPKILAQKIREIIGTEQRREKNIKQNSVYLIPDVDSLVKQISQPQEQFVFFLDDFDKLHDHQAINLIRKIIAQYWQDFTIVVATRRPPKLGLARMRVSGDLLELGPGDLCFNISETKKFFEEKKIDYDEIVHKATEGWPAAIQLATLVLKNGDVKPDKIADVFSSSWVEMNDYFLEEIFGPQEKDIQDCLLETGIFGRFTIDLAIVVTGNKNINKEIEKILKLGLLLVYEGHGNTWLSYHPLFAAFLEEKLKQISQTRFEEIHRGAALWHRENGQISDSIRHAFAAGDLGAAAALLSQASVERKRVGRFRSFTSWTSQLPVDMLDSHPELRIEAACSYAALFELEAARTHINSVKPHYKDLSPKARDDLFAVDAMMAVYADRPDVTIEASVRGLRDCIESDPYTLGTLKHTLAIGQIAGGNISEAKHNIHEGHACHEKAESDFGIAVSYSLKGLSYAVEGDLTRAISSWADAEKIIDNLPTANAIKAIAVGYLPETLFERNDLVKAEEYIDLCFASSIEIAIPDMVITLYLTAARIAFARNNLDKANTLMDQAEVIGLRRGWPRLVYAILWERIRFALYRGRIEEARRLHDQSEKGRPYKELKGFIPHAVETEADKIGAFRLESRFNPGRKLLSDLRVAISSALAENRIWRTIRLLIIEAFTREAMNDRRAALRVLRRALELGVNGYFVRSFIEEGPQIINLVKIIFEEERRAPATIKIKYLETIIEASGGEFSSANTNDNIIEALSKRELDVLKMLAMGLSNKELSDRLFVSEHTVKWHLQHIFEKLEVKNRTRAITIAREHGLIG